MSARIGVTVESANSCEEAVRDAEIVITATSATQIVLEGAWLTPGMHINAMGANWAQKRELDAAAVMRSDLVAVDSIEQARMEAGDLIQAFGEDASRWDDSARAFRNRRGQNCRAESTQTKSLCSNPSELPHGIWPQPCASLN